MKLYAPVNTWQWDEYSAFHHALNHFAQFQTGEVIYTLADPEPGLRRRYGDRNVWICSTADEDCPPLYIPGEPEPALKAWLNREGQQHLAIDLDHGIAVRLAYRDGRGARRERKHTAIVPEHLKDVAAVYWAGPNSPPIGAAVRVQPPRKLSADERAHISDLRDACTTWAALRGAEDRGWAVFLDGRKVTLPASAPSVDLALRSTIADLTDEQRIYIWKHQPAPGWLTYQHPHLLLQPAAA